jgi:hypothetical protein
MTTGRINQIPHLDGHPRGLVRRSGRLPGRPTPPRGCECRYKEGTHEASGRRDRPGVPGETRTTIQLPPLSPSAPVRTQVSQPGRPCGRGLAAAYGPRVEGPDPVDDAGERRIPQGGSLPESRCQGWPAAIHPQTPSVPGTKRPPDFRRDDDARGATHPPPNRCSKERNTQ